MKDLLNKEHYYYKIYTLLMKIYDFSKSQPPINKGVHIMNITYDLLKQSLWGDGWGVHLSLINQRFQAIIKIKLVWV